METILIIALIAFVVFIALKIYKGKYPKDNGQNDFRGQGLQEEEEKPNLSE